jgi:hypothetical protein
VAGDSGGDLLVSTDPNGGASAWTPIRHLAPALDNKSEDAGLDNGVTGVACPTAHACIAVDGSDLLLSTDPTSAAAWHVRAGVDPQDSFVGLVCPSAGLCVAFDHRDVLTSTHPWRGGSRWKRVQVLPKGDSFTDLVCPSRSLCVGTDSDGLRVATTTTPTGAWHVANLKQPHAHEDNRNWVACQSTSACVIVDQALGHSYGWHATKPTGGTKAWTLVKNMFSGAVDEVTCTTTFCLADVNDPWQVQYTTDPTGGASAWHPVYDSSGLSLTWGIGCAVTGGFCMTWANDTIATTVNPTGGQSAWTTADVDAFNALVAIACPSATLCLAADDSSRVLGTTDPAAGGPWQGVTADANGDLTSLACAGVHLCVGGDDAENIVTTTDPGDPMPSWTQRAVNASSGEPNPVEDLTCPSVSLCVGALYNVESDASVEGTSVITSTDPTGGAKAWKETDIDVSYNAPVLTAVACPSVSLCVAVDGAGSEVATNPAGGAWSKVRIAAKGTADAIACPSTSTSLCVAVGGRNVYTTTTPRSGHWKQVTLPSGAGLAAITCASKTLCVALAADRLWTSTDPTGPASAWQPSARTDGALTSIACASSSLCLAGDGEGYVLVGTAS